MNRNRKIVLMLSGAPGTGKTTVKRMAHKFYPPFFGKTAAISTDDIFNIMDLHWETRGENQAQISSNARKISATITNKLFELGYKFVIIEGNSLFEKDWVNEIVAELDNEYEIYHITLHATIDVVDDRINIRGDGNKDREWLLAWLTHIEKFFGEWTHVIDTSNLTEAEMLTSITVAINENRGQLKKSF